MASSAALRLPTYKADSKLSVAKDVIECAEKDYLYLLRNIAAQEIQNQIALNNKPSNIIVDGRGGKKVSEATKSVVVYFANAAQLIAAISGARQMLLAYGRRVTGKTLGDLQYYQQQGKAGVALPVTSFNPNSINAATDLYVGVAAAHARKWQWLTRTGKRGTRQSRNKKLRSGKLRVKLTVSKSIYETAAARMKSRYPRLDILVAYIDTPNLNPSGKTAVSRIPVIKVRRKLRGIL